MQSKLTPTEAALLKLTVAISRETKLFSLKNLESNWGISSMTLFRYDSTKYRERSRKDARIATEWDRAKDRSVCFKCKASLKGHSRCNNCTILLHGKACNCNSLGIARKIALIMSDSLSF